ncbi:MAG TPA: discoidin domain-containing protein, partial [Bacilli bacterium]
MKKNLLICLLIIVLMAGIVSTVSAVQMKSTTASAGSTLSSSYPASNATDSQYESLYISNSSGSNPYATEWLAIDFGFLKYGVNKIMFYAREDFAGFPKDFKLQYRSSDSSAWVDITGQSYTNYTLSRGYTEFNFTAVDAKAVRLYATKLSPDIYGNHYLQIAEMKAEQVASGTDNRLAPTTISSSSAAGSNVANLALDNSVSTYWSSTVYSDDNHQESITLNMNRRYRIDHVKLTPRASGLGFPVDFQIQWSFDGTTYYPISGQTYTSYSNPGSTAQVFRFAEVNAKSIKIVATKLGSASPNYAFQLGEIEANS